MLKNLLGYRFNYQSFLLPVLIGLFAGFFAIIFLKAIEISSSFFLGGIVSYEPPLPYGEGGSPVFDFFMERPYLLPISTTIGGFIVGLLIYYFSPESSGVGTDAAIKAFHHRKKLGIKTSIMKLITSSITIGSGGVSGKEGPIALIGAGIGSFLGRMFKLSDRERDIALAVGMGAGIAGVFKAPFAGAIISSEVFYKKDFETETLIPSFIASFIAFIVVGSFLGFSPLFHIELPEFNGLSLNDAVAYIILGVSTAMISRLMIFSLDKSRDLFNSLGVHPIFKPAVGGFFVGIIGMVTPIAIGTGYGWLQMIMTGNLIYLSPLLIVLSIFLVILAFSFTLGSGGSGGVFGPSLVIGGLTGASVYYMLSNLGFQETASFNITALTVVGMVSTFAAAAKAPLSTLILVAEITGGYQLLVPAIIAVAISHFLSGEKSIFKSQVDYKINSPVHQDEFKFLILQQYKVEDVMTSTVITVSKDTPVIEVGLLLQKYGISLLPVVENDVVIGVITDSDMIKACNQDMSVLKVKDIMNYNPICVTPDLSLFKTLSIFIENNIGIAPVVDDIKNKKLLGIVSDFDIGKVLTGGSQLR
ncbi:chloride channel protein [Persephonella sp.]